MAQPAVRHEDHAHQPSVIIDPSLYVPERRTLLESVCETFIELTRVAVIVVLPATVVLGVGKAAWQRPVQDRAAPTQTVLLEVQPVAANRVEDRVGTTEAVVREVQPLAAYHFESEPTSEGSTERLLLSSKGADTPVCAVRREDAFSQTSERLTSAAPRVHEMPAVSVRPASVDLTVGVRVGRRMLALNRLDAAAAAYRKVLAADARQAAALMGLSRVQLARGQLDEAFSLAQRAAESDPHQVGSHLILGDVLRAKGDRARADAQYALATSLAQTKTEPSDEQTGGQYDPATRLAQTKTAPSGESLQPGPL